MSSAKSESKLNKSIDGIIRLLKEGKIIFDSKGKTMLEWERIYGAT
jgi:hypothetical protein